MGQRWSEIGLVNDGSAGSTNTLGERGREETPPPSLSWD